MQAQSSKSSPTSPGIIQKKPEPLLQKNTKLAQGSQVNPLQTALDNMSQAKPNPFQAAQTKIQSKTNPFQAAAQKVGLQTKLSIGQPNDTYEQEADRMAEQVLSSSPKVQKTQALSPLDLSSKKQDISLSPLNISQVPQGAAVIQRDPPNGSPTPATPVNQASSESSSGSSGRDPLSQAVADLLRDQLSDQKLTGHLNSLGRELQSMAVQATADETQQTSEPQASGNRMAALGIAQAFQTTSRAIVADPDLQRLRQAIVRIAGDSPETVLAGAIAALIGAYLADVDLSAEPSSGNIAESGVSIGGSLDFGSIQNVEFNHIRAYVEYASRYFSARIGGGVRQETPETEGESPQAQIVGEAEGRIRIGTEETGISGRIRVDTIGSATRLTLSGRLALSPLTGRAGSLTFSTDVEGGIDLGGTPGVPGSPQAVQIRPQVSGRFNLRGNQYLRIGGGVDISPESGVQGVRGYVEYGRDELRLRIEGNSTGLPEASGIRPGGNMGVQALLTVPFDFGR